MKRIWLLLIVCFVILSVKPANAQIISFGDTSKYWPGWFNGTGDDSQDTIGIPNFTGGSATVTNDRLTGLTINQSITSSPYWPVVSPGDLFIDVGGNQTWDYVVDLTSWTVSGASNSDPAAGNYNLYAINLALDSSTGYIKSGTDNSGDWAGYYIRDGHPVATNLNLINGNPIYFSGWNGSPAAQYSFNFSGLNGGGLNLGESGKFTIGWGANCANDVIYETLNYTASPEPASFSLFGMGLLGLAGFLRKRKKV